MHAYLRLTSLCAASAIGLAAVTGCGGHKSTGTTGTTAVAARQAKAAQFIQCAQTLQHYQALATAMGPIGTNPADTANYGPAVADAATLKTDLITIRPQGTPAQQAQIDQYATVLTQLGAGLQTAAGGDFQGATGEITGVAQQVGQIPDLITGICHI